MKCALLRGFESSLAAEFDSPGVGRNLVKRENKDCGAGGGGFRMDFPGIGMVTAEEDGEHDAVIGCSQQTAAARLQGWCRNLGLRYSDYRTGHAQQIYD
jgi:hypothetical protein